MTSINVSINQSAINVTTTQKVINVTMIGGASNNFVEVDTKFSFNGLDGNSYIIYNSSLDRLELYKGGALKAAW